MYTTYRLRLFKLLITSIHFSFFFPCWAAYGRISNVVKTRSLHSWKADMVDTPSRGGSRADSSPIGCTEGEAISSAISPREKNYSSQITEFFSRGGIIFKGNLEYGGKVEKGFWIFWMLDGCWHATYILWMMSFSLFINPVTIPVSPVNTRSR